MSFGAQSVVVEECRQDNQAEQEIFGQSEELWDTCNLIAHFELEVHHLAVLVHSASFKTHLIILLPCFKQRKSYERPSVPPMAVVACHSGENVVGLACTAW